MISHILKQNHINTYYSLRDLNYSSNTLCCTKLSSQKRLVNVLSTNVLLFTSALKRKIMYCDSNLNLLSTTNSNSQQHASSPSSPPTQRWHPPSYLASSPSLPLPLPVPPLSHPSRVLLPSPPSVSPLSPPSIHSMSLTPGPYPPSSMKKMTRKQLQMATMNHHTPYDHLLHHPSPMRITSPSFTPSISKVASPSQACYVTSYRCDFGMKVSKLGS